MPDDDSGDARSSLLAPGDEGRGRQKRLELIDELLRGLDVLLFAQLAALYYLDCLTASFLLRTLVQIFFLSPRATGLPDPLPARPHLSLVLGSNVLCLLLHLVREAPEAGEITRGYLHGGLFLDFVGELGPVSRWRLVALDLWICGIQMVMMAAIVQKLKIKGPASSAAAPSTAQDHDAEEMGVRRSADGQLDDSEHVGEGEDGIEMRNLLDEPAEAPNQSSVHPLDNFYTGDVMLLELDIVNDIRQHLALEPPPGTVESSIDSARFRTLVGGLLRLRRPVP